jgi:outer membrane protein assembly factor BamB
MVLNVPGQVKAFDPRTGDPLWWCSSARDYASSSPVVSGGTVYSVVANTHGGGGSVVVRAGGDGDVSGSRVVWHKRYGAQVSSPAYHGGYLYWSSINPRVARHSRAAYCADARTGELMYQQKLEPEPTVIYSSPLIADGKIYYLSQQAGMYVLAEGPEFRLLAHNRIESEPEDSYFNASPVPLEGGRLLLRSDWGLYCIGPGEK